MLGKFGIFIVILVLVFIFFIVISFGAGLFSKKEKNPEIKKYLKSVNILLLLIIVVGAILVLFL
jgi:O-antigen/teichoic acid export membrane protein|tara:strand:- start:72 stop:263 length:192 start_codon:yes stop_codon:yes gene_type:complete